MSRFSDLVGGKKTTPAPVVEEAPRPEEEVADTVAAPLSFDAMSKDELEDYGRTIGIELDRRLSKKKLVTQLEDHIQYLESV